MTGAATGRGYEFVTTAASCPIPPSFDFTYQLAPGPMWHAVQRASGVSGALKGLVLRLHDRMAEPATEGRRVHELHRPIPGGSEHPDNHRAEYGEQQDRPQVLGIAEIHLQCWRGTLSPACGRRLPARLPEHACRDQNQTENEHGGQGREDQHANVGVRLYVEDLRREQEGEAAETGRHQHASQSRESGCVVGGGGACRSRRRVQIHPRCARSVANRSGRERGWQRHERPPRRIVRCAMFHVNSLEAARSHVPTVPPYPMLRWTTSATTPDGAPRMTETFHFSPRPEPRHRGRLERVER